MNIDETVAEVLRLDAEATPGAWYDAAQADEAGDDVEILTDLPEAWAANLPEALCPWRWDDRPICTLAARPDAFRPGLPHSQRVADAALIAYYRTAAPALAREVQRLQIILEACDERSQMCLEAEEEADAELSAALDEIERLRACALPSEGAYIAGRVDGERIGFRSGSAAMRERAAAICEAAAGERDHKATGDPYDEGWQDCAGTLMGRIEALEVKHD